MNGLFFQKAGRKGCAAFQNSGALVAVELHAVLQQVSALALITDQQQLFVLAIAIHNIPEGIASGVAFGMGNVGDALLVSLSIALQNIPEGMVLISPMISIGIPKRKAFVYAAFTGLTEVGGAFIGYFTVSISELLLPLFLALAGGSMLYVISDEMIPETHSRGNGKAASLALVAGFLAMVLFDAFI